MNMNAGHVTLLIVFPLWMLCGCGETNSAKTLYNQGRAATAAGKLDEALANFELAIKLKPDLAEAYLGRGMTYVQLSGSIEMDQSDRPKPMADFDAQKTVLNLDKAFADLDQAIMLKPVLAEAYAARGMAHMRRVELNVAMGMRDKGKMMAELDSGIADCNEAIRLKPTFALAYYSRAILYGARREFDKALADYHEAIRLNPRAAAFYCKRGLTYEKLGQRDEAVADYRQAQELGLSPALKKQVEIHLHKILPDDPSPSPTDTP